MKKNIKKGSIFIMYIIFFSISIFFIRNYFFYVPDIDVEEYYIEKTIFVDNENVDNGNIVNYDKNIKKESIKDESIKEKNIKEIEKKNEKQIIFSYIPDLFEKEISEYSLLLSLFLNKDYIKEKINNLKVEFYIDLIDVRGKMKNRVLKLYGVKKMNEKEFLSVSIHEFAHYLDLYYLERKVLKDISDYFYDISWEKTTTIKAGQKQSDFISGYAMTNKYEDFSECFTYYVLHNSDFIKKSEKSEFLKKKYDFFTKYLFRNKEFLNSDFNSLGNRELQDYYRDVTKIDFDLDIFLQFMKKGI